MMEAEASEVDEREQLKQLLLSRIVKVDGPLDTQWGVDGGLSEQRRLRKFPLERRAVASPPSFLYLLHRPNP